MEAEYMTEKKVLLVNSPHLLQDMLRKIFNKTPGIRLVAEIDNLADFSEIASRTDAGWAIVFTDLDNKVPTQVERAINDHPQMRFLLMKIDGSHVRMKWNEPHEVALDEINLKDLLAIMVEDQPERTIA
jgi:hypothetical protein